MVCVSAAGSLLVGVQAAVMSSSKLRINKVVFANCGIMVNLFP